MAAQQATCGPLHSFYSRLTASRIIASRAARDANGSSVLDTGLPQRSKHLSSRPA
jgi:hypothetical protein